MAKPLKKLDETPEELLVRIKPLIEAIDLDQIDPMAQGVINSAELGGTPLPDWSKHLLILKCDGVITHDQTMDLTAHFISVHNGG